MPGHLNSAGLACPDGRDWADRLGRNGHRSGADRALRHNAELRRLVHIEAQADRQLARGLALLWRDELYRPLGFVRATDFVREMLGIKESRARWLAKLGLALHAVPEIDKAHAEGRIGASHVMELSKIVSARTPVDERLAWIERAAGKTVRALRRDVLERPESLDANSIHGRSRKAQARAAASRRSERPGT